MVSHLSGSSSAGLALCVLTMIPASTGAQPTTPPPPRAASAAPRVLDGKPSLEGFWDFRTLTSLQRPENLKDKTVLTEDEARDLQNQNANRRARAAAPSNVNAPPRQPGGGGRAVGGYND